MGLSKVQSRGQVTIPADARRAAGLAPGDVVLIEAAGKGKLRLTALPTREPLDAVFKRYGGPGKVVPHLWDQVAEDVVRDVVRPQQDAAPPRRPARGKAR